MRRWNGWGLEGREVALPEPAEALLRARLGPLTPPRDARLSEVATGVPESRLPCSPLLDTDPELRVRHARGQSLPDWIALRSGRLGLVPDAVARPTDEGEVRSVLALAREAGAQVIPYGGGSSVVGHVNPRPGPPVVTLSLARLSALHALDPRSRRARFGAGILGPDLEAALRAQGLTLGHFPQSFEHSTLGGWVATRSSGQQSLAYGRIERLFAGGRLLLPDGDLLELPSHPASAAGPDLRELVLGSEGRLGVITEVTVRASPVPEMEVFEGAFLPDWEQGLALLRELAPRRCSLSLLRLLTEVETEASLSLGGSPRLARALEGYLRLRGLGPGRCLLLLGFSGPRRLVRASRHEVWAWAARHGAIRVGAAGRAWERARFRSAYLRNTLWERGCAVDTLETATDWARLPGLRRAVEDGIRQAFEAAGEAVQVSSHVSHVYADGGSLYTTFLFRQAPDPEATLVRWQSAKQAACRAIVAARATISHQHGVGLDHRDHLPAEKGAPGMALLQALLRQADPGGRMNPGKLL